MADKKVTKREHYETLLTIQEVLENQTLVDFINHELELLDKKNLSRKGELTETQKENQDHKKAIVEWIGDKEITISQVRAKFGFSPQKATPLMNDLVKEGTLIKRVEKRVSYFKKA